MFEIDPGAPAQPAPQAEPSPVLLELSDEEMREVRGRDIS